MIRKVPEIPKSVSPNKMTNDDNLRNNMRGGIRSLEDKHEREMVHIQELWQAEVEMLNMKELETEKIIRDLKARIKHLTEAQKARQEDVNDVLETRLFEDLETIYRLTKQNRELHKSARLTDLSLPGTLHLGHELIDDAMDQIQFELSSISYHRKNYQRHLSKDVTISGDLASLVHSAFGSDIGTSDGRKKVETIMSKFDVQVCIRALVLAAVKGWVFMSNFPNFAPSANRLMSNYRAIIFGISECSHVHR